MFIFKENVLPQSLYTTQDDMHPITNCLFVVFVFTVFVKHQVELGLIF